MITQPEQTRVNVDIVTASLFSLLALILLLPLFVRKVEENLEVFFLGVGLIATTITGKWFVDGTLNVKLIEEALLTPVMIHEGVPIGIFQVVLIAGLFFHFTREATCKRLMSLLSKIGFPTFALVLTLAFGLSSSLISVIVSSVVLSELLLLTPVDRKHKVIATIIACYALGLGAALTPVGEPLSTIAVAKLKGPPYYADFFFLLRLLGDYIIPMVLALSITNFVYVKHIGKAEVSKLELYEVKKEKINKVVGRAFRVYVFIMALVLLGSSYEVLVEKYFKFMSSEVLYFVGAISAVVDNATLTAAFIGPELELAQIKSFLLSLLISGGFLIPGNIPNIIAAEIIGIRFKEWARYAIPIGVPIFLAVFALLFILGF